MSMNDNPLVVLHVPKTAGTSLRKIIKNNYIPEELLFVYDNHPNFFSTRELKNLSLEDINKFKVIMGHIQFDIKIFPCNKFNFLTFVRDPVNRVISYYHHVMTHNKVWSNKKISLLKYIETSNDLQLSNHQTRVLAGLGGNPVTDKHLKAAISNIDNYFCFVGISERFVESISFMAGMFNWENSSILHENASIGKPDAAFFSDMEIERIKELNKLDIELYNYIESNFVYFVNRTIKRMRM